jgi:uncharacterized membrane protein required for colicin V production
MAPVDAVVAAILALAAMRGLGIGLVREAFSLGAIGTACVAVTVYTDRLSEWLLAESNGEIGAMVAPWLATGILVVAGVAASAVVGRLARRGARMAGLGWIDRAGGAALGSAEGVLIAGTLLWLATTLLGRDHRIFEGARSMAALDQLQQVAATGEIPLPDVAAPPRFTTR